MTNLLLINLFTGAFAGMAEFVFTARKVEAAVSLGPFQMFISSVDLEVRKLFYLVCADIPNLTDHTYIVYTSQS